MNSQSQAQERYFGHARREIAPLLPDHAQRVLEIGCSSGATLAWLRDRWPHAEMLGVDGHAPLAPVIRARAARAVIHDLETPLPDLGTFDLILAPNMIVYHPARTNMADMAAKWRRQTAHDLADHQRTGRSDLIWLARMAALMVITPVHALRILASPRVHGLASRLRGVACLAHIRRLRVREMWHQWADPAHEGATGWNRGA